jgi:hypothetical protein
LAGTEYFISKTSFLKFDQCPKAFFFYKNLPFLKDKPTVDKQLTFRRGHDVGFFAQQLFPGGTDISKITSSADEAIEKTTELIAAGHEVIYEATLVHNGVLVMVDILRREEGRFTAYEIKSSLRVSEVYLKDAFLQYYVLKNALQQFNELYLVTLNPDYRLEGEIDPKKLFRRRRVGQQAAENFAYLEFHIDSAQKLLEVNRIPNIPIGRQCFKPYQCDYFSVCWKDTINAKSVFNLPMADKGTLFEWYDAGHKNIEQVPDELIRKDALVKIKNAFVLNEPIINYQAIEHLLTKVTAPYAAMDMEVWSPALPVIQGTGPFEQVPFLVSFFDGNDFTFFFSGKGGDERETFAEQLLMLSERYSTILVYDRNLEVNIIERLSVQYPHLSDELRKIKNKIVDVFDVFLRVDYYHPGFRNNFSLKTVSSVLLEDISYTAITSGLEAMSYYEQYRLSENEIEKEYFRNELVNYCHTDTQATLGLFHFLKKKAG